MERGASAVSVSADNAQYSGADTEDGGSVSPDQLHVSFTGPASQESYTVTINWGGADADDDGTTTFSLNPGQTSFVYPLPQYAVAGTYPITLTVTDAESNYAASSAFYVTYTNSAPSALVLSLDQSTVTAGSGEPNLSGSFTDPQFNIAHVVTIDWGDETAGSPADTTTIDLDPGETTFQAEPNSTTYAAAGTYPISVTVTGVDGTTTADKSVTVTPVPAEVMVGATTPEASEYLGLSYAASDGAFAVTCGGGSAGNVSVNFTLSGATYGTDYTLSGSGYTIVSQSGPVLTGTISMPGDGPTTATIYVEPYNLDIVGGSETLTMTINSGTNYNAMTGWSAAHVTINDDDPDLNNPPTGDPTPQITAFDPDGSPSPLNPQGESSASALVGDFIPIGIWVSSGEADLAMIGLNYPSTICVSYTPGGANLYGGSGGGTATFDGPSGPPGRGSPYYLVLYASAADPTDDQANDTEVSGDISLVSCSGGSSSFATVSTSVDFEPLQMLNNGTEISGIGYSGNQNVKVGQLMGLQVEDPSWNGGIVVWSTPEGNTVKNYQPTGANGQAAQSCQAKYLTLGDQFAIAVGAQPSVAPLSFAWVTGGTSYFETATLYNPFGVASAVARFNVEAPVANAQRRHGGLCELSGEGI